MSNAEKDQWLRIKDLEGEFDQMNLYEPDDRKYADFVKREIDEAYDVLVLLQNLPSNLTLDKKPSVIQSGATMSEEEKNQSTPSLNGFQLHDQLMAKKKKRLEELKETIAEHNPEALFADGHDHAIMGYSSDGRVIYSVDQIVGGLVERDGMTKDEAIEFFDFNIAGAYVGEYTPIYMYKE